MQLRRPDGVAVQLLPSSTDASRFHFKKYSRSLKFKENNCPRPFLPNFLLEPFTSMYCFSGTVGDDDRSLLSLCLDVCPNSPVLFFLAKTSIRL